MDAARLERIRRLAGEDGETLTPAARDAVRAALTAADDGNRAAALEWARSASRWATTPADRSAARALLAALDHGRSRDALRSRSGEPARRSTRTAGVVVAAVLALAIAALVGARALFAPRLDARGPDSGARIGAASLDELAFTVDGGTAVRWTLDGEDVSARAGGRANTVFRPQSLSEGAHRLEVRRGGGFLGASATHVWEFTVDTTSPSIRLRSRPAVQRGATLVAQGTVEVGSRVTVDRGPVDVDEGRFVFRVPPPVPRSILIEAVDLAGNRSSRRFSVDVVPRRPPVPVRGVHVTAYAWADASLRRGVMDLIDERRINAVEIDLKDESGEIGFDAPVRLGQRIGAVKRIYDLDDVVSLLHARGVRVIGRLVCFRDPVLARTAWERGERSRVVQSPAGGPYASDYGGFTNFADPAVRKYNIDVAVAAARAGVDDILYDYVRRPDGPRESMVFPGLRATPEHSIAEFVRETRRALEPYGTYLGVSVFGVAATRPLEVGQDIPRLAREVDYIAPMVYPSHWRPGEYGVAAPNSQPYAIVLRSLRDFVKQTRGTGARVVPWLQDFSLGVPYGEAEIRGQIRATYRSGIGEFLLWDPAVSYTSKALDPGARTSTRGLARPSAGQAPAR